MNLNIDKKKKKKVGKKAVIESMSPVYDSYMTVFEDDGETGFFYAVDKHSESYIVDALHIYNVMSVSDKDTPSEFSVAWSNDGLASILLINDYPHAIIDFKSKRGYCRTGFPPSSDQSDWSRDGHSWDEDTLTLFN